MDFLVQNYFFFLVSLFLFLYCYFPISQNAQENIKPPSKLMDITFDTEKYFKPDVDRLVFIVIDALRLDFLTKEYMPFTLSKISEHGCIFPVKVQSPTVTLPRIKSLTTGSIPQFIDVVLNLASIEAATDSFLHKAKDKQKKIVFYGDDTWLKLYPNIFDRSEGVSSFYVNDFTEVDENVTRNVEEELKNEDWDVMFLHYLGNFL